MMTGRRVVSGACICALWALVASGPVWAGQAGDAAAPTLRVTGDVSTPLSLAPSELKLLPRTRVAVTAPYMHDGSVATLEEAIDHYSAGGRAILDGPYKGLGRDNPNKSASIRGFTLTSEQRADLVAFLQSLTDEALLRDPRFSNPWTSARRR